MFQHFPAIITVCTLFLLVGTALAVAAARNKYKIHAPATVGDANFERVFRVQMNTQESAIVFLPALWLFSNYVSPLWAGILGAVWLFGRVLYAFAYIRAAHARTSGFVIAFTAFVILVLGATVGIGQALLN